MAHLNHSLHVVTISLVSYQDRRQLPGEILWLELKLMAATAVTTCVRHDDGKGGLMTVGIERAIRNFVRYTNDEMNPILMPLRRS